MTDTNNHPYPIGSEVVSHGGYTGTVIDHPVYQDGKDRVRVMLDRDKSRAMYLAQDVSPNDTGIRVGDHVHRELSPGKIEYGWVLQVYPQKKQVQVTPMSGPSCQWPIKAVTPLPRLFDGDVVVCEHKQIIIEQSIGSMYKVRQGEKVLETTFNREEIENFRFTGILSNSDAIPPVTIGKTTADTPYPEPPPGGIPPQSQPLDDRFVESPKDNSVKIIRMGDMTRELFRNAVEVRLTAMKQEGWHIREFWTQNIQNVYCVLEKP